MTRKLQNRLALASYKAKHGCEIMNLEMLEAEVENRLKRRRAGSSVVSSSDSSSSSTVSDHTVYPGGFSSPTAAPFFSDITQSSDTMVEYGKRTRFQTTSAKATSSSSRRRSSRPHSMAPPQLEPGRQTWKSKHNLADSSPLQSRLHPDFRTTKGPSISFVSEVPTTPNSPPFGAMSDDEDQDLPVHSFQINRSDKRGSPPRTPPPTRSRSMRNRKGNATGEEGADLLLFLATSPSPADAAAKSRVFPPSTPPTNHAALSSSMIATPGGSNLYGLGTPGQQFNFADFVNVTPSPAQGAFGSRTPGLTRTPLAARDARRRLNFDNLVPHGGSPSIGSSTNRGSTNAGLGMELGGELVS